MLMFYDRAYKHLLRSQRVMCAEFLYCHRDSVTPNSSGNSMGAETVSVQVSRLSGQLNAHPKPRAFRLRGGLPLSINLVQRYDFYSDNKMPSFIDRGHCSLAGFPNV